MPARRLRLSALVAALVAVALAGCAAPAQVAEGDAGSGAEAPTPASMAPTLFEPDFQLVAPEILVTGGAPHLPGAELRFAATFPASAKVDPARVRDVLWDFGDGGLAVGLEARHAFTKGGLHTVKLSVRDVYDRSAETSIVVPVAEARAFSGIVPVGDGAADARPADGTLPHDHVDHALPVPGGVRTLQLAIAFQATGACPQPPLCVPAESNLVLRLFSPSGEKLAEAATGTPPRLLEVTLDAPGDHVLRVSGDRGVDVAYDLTALLLYEAP